MLKYGSAQKSAAFPAIQIASRKFIELLITAHGIFREMYLTVSGKMILLKIQTPVSLMSPSHIWTTIDKSQNSFTFLSQASRKIGNSLHFYLLLPSRQICWGPSRSTFKLTVKSSLGWNNQKNFSSWEMWKIGDHFSKFIVWLSDTNVSYFIFVKTIRISVCLKKLEFAIFSVIYPQTSAYCRQNNRVPLKIA